jgi:hypothetical protein
MNTTAPSKIKHSIGFPQPLLAKLRREAKELGLTVSEYVRTLVDEALRERERHSRQSNGA